MPKNRLSSTSKGTLGIFQVPQVMTYWIIKRKKKTDTSFPLTSMQQKNIFGQSRVTNIYLKVNLTLKHKEKKDKEKLAGFLGNDFQKHQDSPRQNEECRNTHINVEKSSNCQKQNSSCTWSKKAKPDTSKYKPQEFASSLGSIGESFAN